MSRKRGKIENPILEENITVSEDKAQDLIDKMYKVPEHEDKQDDNKKTLENEDAEEELAPQKTLWEIALEDAENETEYINIDPFYKRLPELMLKASKQAGTILKEIGIFLWKNLCILTKRIIVKIKELKAKRHDRKNKQSELKSDNKKSLINIKTIKIKKNQDNDLVYEIAVRKRGTFTSEIAFVGLSSGAGTTYSAFLCASALKKKYKICVLELNSSGHFSSIFEYLYQEVPHQRKMFKYDGVDYYFNIPYMQFVQEFRAKYDFIIIDYSTTDNITDYIDLARCDRIFAITDGTYWRLNELKKTILRLSEKDRAKTIVYLTPAKEPMPEIKKICNPNLVSGIPYNKNPFRADENTVKTFYKLLKIKYKR